MKNCLNRRILILDNDESIRNILEFALKDNDYEVKCLASTDDILREIAIFKPGLVLLDHVLPGIKGGEHCRRIKSSSLTLNLPVILFSAYPRSHQSQAEHCPDVFIGKPFDLWALIDTIDKFFIKQEQYEYSR